MTAQSLRTNVVLFSDRGHIDQEIDLLWITTTTQLYGLAIELLTYSIVADPTQPIKVCSQERPLPGAFPRVATSLNILVIWNMILNSS